MLMVFKHFIHSDGKCFFERLRAKIKINRGGNKTVNEKTDDLIKWRFMFQILSVYKPVEARI